MQSWSSQGSALIYGLHGHGLKGPQTGQVHHVVGAAQRRHLAFSLPCWGHWSRWCATEIHRHIFRLHAWWILVQSWRTLSCSDHRGKAHADVAVTGDSFSARLTRSKTPGSDRQVAARIVVVFSRHEHWGWELLRTMADYPRDYFVPAAASNHQVCRMMELQCAFGFCAAKLYPQRI